MKPSAPRVGCRRRGFAGGVLLAGSLLSALTQAQESQNATQRLSVLAPGYGALEFTAPAAGSYELPPLGEAADGEVLLTSGEPARLHGLFDGHVVLLSFIYTRCNDANGCPLASHVLNNTLARLNRQPSISSSLRAVSLSFDPVNDTPESLSRFSRGMVSGNPNWQFVTTESEQKLAPILAAYGQNRIAEIDPAGKASGSYAHALRVFLIDRQRRIRNIYSVGFLHPDVLANDIATVLADRQPDPAVAVTRTTPLLGPGDDKAGYESAEYITRNRDLRQRVGTDADLIAFAEAPPLGLPRTPVPADNPLTPAKIELGRKLFFDRRMSLNNTLSCAMCHIPEQGFANNELQTAVGFEGRTVRRNAPSVFNVAYMTRLFYDGRESTLEQQVWQPLLASNEMANPAIGVVLDRIRGLADYRGMFEAAFAGRGPTMETLGQALASYQRTLNAADSPFDRWYFGTRSDATAFSPQAEQGFELFRGKAGCSGCHTLDSAHALFTDRQFHNTGIGWHHSMRKEPASRKVQLAPGVYAEVDSRIINAAAEPRPNDLGRYEVTLDPADRWRYRTPSLRNVALTAPYMHNGSLATLGDVVKYYNAGGYSHDLLDPRIRPLGLSDTDIDALVAFLNSLTGATVAPLVSDGLAAPIGDPRG